MKEGIRYPSFKKAACTMAKADGIASFCNIEVARAQMLEILRRCSFEFMKENEQGINPFPSGGRGAFIRKGNMRQWEAYLTPEQNRMFEAKCNRRFTGLGLGF
jgi:hypothetical protein